MRIVSLCPSTTETLVAFGLGGSLAGVTRYCDHPREALEGIPRVGGTKDPDHGAIAAWSGSFVPPTRGIPSSASRGWTQ